MRTVREPLRFVVFYARGCMQRKETLLQLVLVWTNA